MSPASAKADLVLDLDKPVNAQLLPTSEYHLDPKETLGFDSIEALDASEWQSFKRDQFKFGLTTGFIWVKTSIRTTGSRTREIALKTHQSLDKQQLRLSTQGEDTRHFKFGLGSTPAHIHEDELMHHDELNITEIKPDHVTVKLAPNKIYHLIWRSNSSNPVIGDFRALDHDALISEGKSLESWLYAYLALALLIVIYCSGIFFISKDLAYLAHMGYMISIITYLLADSGYLSIWFGLFDLLLLQKIIMLSLTCCLLSIMLFIKIMYAEFKRYSTAIRYLYNSVVCGGILTLLLMLTTSYELAIRVFSVEAAIAIAASMYLLYRSYIDVPKQYWLENYRSLTLITILLIFTPITTIHLTTRLGFINVTWLTDYVLFLSVFIEIFLISGILLLNLSSSKKAYQIKALTNNISSLPNDIALERQLFDSNNQSPQALVQIWISGFDGLQTTLGTVSFCSFIQIFGKETNHQLAKAQFLNTIQTEATTEKSFFHSDQNTFILLCRPLNEDEETQVIEIIKSAINTAVDHHHEHFDFQVSIGAYVFAQMPRARVRN